MTYLFTPEETAFRAHIRNFVQSNLPSDIRKKMFGGLHPDRQDVARWTAILHKQGWAAYPWPTEYGGAGFTPIQRYIFEDECAAGGAPEIIPFGVKMCGQVLIQYGSKAQKERFLMPMAQLIDYWCQGYSEPNSGSDLATLRTRAKRVDGGYLVNGQKVWTTSAHEADWIFTLVRTSDEAKPQSGISFLLIDLRSPGVSIRPIMTLDGRHEINEVWFDDVLVEQENLVGEEGKGWEYAKYLLEHERLNFGGMGFCKRELSRLKERLTRVKRSGRLLIEDPHFMARFASINAELKAIDLTNLRFLREVGEGKQNPLQAPMLKIVSSEIQSILAEAQLRAEGALGLEFYPEQSNIDHDYAAENYANMRKVTIYAGSNEVQRNIAAKGLLG